MPARRKLATLLFCDLSGSTAMGERVDAESVRELTFRYFAEMEEAIERHGGTVEKFIGDAVVAIFGVPTAREDDAVRAVRAAAEMQARIAALNEDLQRRFGVALAVRIGVNSGEVVAGEASARMALVTGDAVNVAARLEQAAAPGDVLLGEATYGLVRHAVAAEPVPPIEAKGKSEPVAAYRLRSVVDETAAARPLRNAFIGRGTELTALEAAFADTAREGAARLAVVVGEPGVGKSRLAHELAERVAASAGADVLRGRCLSYGEGISFWPIAEIVRAAAGMADDDPPDRARARLADLLADQPEGPRMTGLVAQALGLGGGSAPAEEIAWAIRSLLRALAQRRPLLLVVDDLHWGEEALLDVLAGLPESAADAPLLVLCLARQELLRRAPEWPIVLELRPLAGTEATRLVESLLGGGALPAAVTDRIGAVAAGNPLFAEELVGMLVERGALTRDEADGWVATDRLETIDIPPTVGALLEARLDGLPAELREVLERGAVEGQEFHRGAVVALSDPSDQDGVGAALERLEEQGLIHAEPGTFAHEGGFRFRHVLIRDAAYRGVSRRLRAELHERLARWLQAVAGERIGEVQEVLAYHLEAAFRHREALAPVDEAGRALAHEAGREIVAAGRRAWDRGDVRAAAKLLERAPGLLGGDPPARGGALVSLAALVGELGELERANDLLGEALALARSADDRRTEWRAVSERVAIRGTLEGGQSPSDVDEVERAVAELAGLGDDEGAARASVLAGQLHFWLGDTASGAGAWDAGLVHARRAGARAAESELLAWALIGSWFGPEPVERALRRCEEILAEPAHHRRTTAQALVERAALLAAAGRGDAARAALGDGLAIIDELGLTLLRGIVSQEAFDVEWHAGDPIAAEQAARHGCALLEELGEHGYLGSRLGCLADALCDQGRYDEAHTITVRLERDEPVDDVDVQWRWRAVRARVLARRGEAAAARALAAEAVDLIEATDWLNWRGQALLARADVLAVVGETAQALTAASEARARFEAKGNVVAAARAASFDVARDLAHG